MKYKNKVDNYYYLIYGVIFASMIISSLVVIALHINIFYVIIACIVLIITLFYLYLFNNRNYEVTKANLIIRMGPFKEKYRLKDIKKSYIKKSRKLTYATSVRRICIEFKDGKTIGISPLDMEEVLLKIINNGGKK